jgi:hypothetical protein
VENPEVAHLFGDKQNASFSELVAHIGELKTMGEGSDPELRAAALSLLKGGGMVRDSGDALAIVPPAAAVEKQLDWYAPGDVFHSAFSGPAAPLSTWRSCASSRP